MPESPLILLQHKYAFNHFTLSGLEKVTYRLMNRFLSTTGYHGDFFHGRHKINENGKKCHLLLQLDNNFSRVASANVCGIELVNGAAKMTSMVRAQFTPKKWPKLQNMAMFLSRICLKNIASHPAILVHCRAPSLS